MKKPDEDNLCFFRCLKMHFKNVNTVIYYLNRWRSFNYIPLFTSNTINFDGVTLNDISKLEECFNVKIKMFYMNPSGS